MRRLLVAGAALASCLAAATPAGAKSVCHLLVDNRADATQLYVAPDGVAPNDPAADILSADIVSNGARVTTALRVAAFARSGQTAPTGYAWYVYFTAGGVELYTVARSEPLGDTFEVGYVGPESLRTPIATVTPKGAVDGNEIRVTFDTAALRPVVTWQRGTRVTGLRALTNRAFGKVVLQADEALGGKAYVDGTPSCVRAGS